MADAITEKKNNVLDEKWCSVCGKPIDPTGESFMCQACDEYFTKPTNHITGTVDYKMR